MLAAALAITCALLFYTASTLTLDTNTTNMLDARLPFRQLEKDIERAFPQFIDLIVIVVDAPTAAGAEAAASTLVATIRQTPGLARSIYQPGQNEFFSRNGLLFLEKQELWELSDRLAEAAPFLGSLASDTSLRGLFLVLGRALGEDLSAADASMLKTILDDISSTAEAHSAARSQGSAPPPMSWQNQLFGDMQTLGTRRFILVQPRVDFTSLQPGAAALATLRQFAQPLAASESGLRIRFTGSVAIDDEELKSVAQNAEIATVVSFMLVCLILVIGLRSWQLTVAILITLVIGLVWTAAFAAFAIGYLNLISVTFAVLFIGLAVDFGIQFAMRYREEFERGDSSLLALDRAAAGVGGALTLAALAAAISFLAFVPTSYRGLAELGIISAFGMLIALLANLTLLPALLSLMPVRKLRKPADAGLLGRLNFPVQRYRKVILGAAMLAALGSLVLLPQLRFDFNPLNMKDPSTESVATFLDLSGDPQTTPYTLDVLVADQAAAEQLAKRLEALAVVDKTIMLSNFVPGDQAGKLLIIEDMAQFLQPLVSGSSAVAAPNLQQSLTAWHAFRTILKKHEGQLVASTNRLATAMQQLETNTGWPGQTMQMLTTQILGDLPAALSQLKTLLRPEALSLADIPDELRQRYITPDGRMRIEVFPKEDVSDNAVMTRFVQAVKELAPNAIGTPVALVAASAAVIEACLQASLTALVAAAIVLLIVLRSVSAALLVLLPLALAALFTVASSVLFDIPLNLANVIALPLLLGLGIAFGIYLVMRARSGLVVHELFDSSTPRAVLFSALTTVSSFGALAFSNHRGMASMGVLLTLALLFAMVCTLVVLPAIMAKSRL